MLTIRSHAITAFAFALSVVLALPRPAAAGGPAPRVRSSSKSQQRAKARVPALSPVSFAVPAIGSGAALFLALTDDDEELSRSISRSRDEEARDVAVLGKALGEIPLNFGVLTTVGAYGWITGDLTAFECSRGGLAAAAVTTGLIVPTLKVAFGRSRPNADQGSHSFDPVDGPGRSFPSGHTALAFSLAGTIDTFYPGWPGRVALVLASTTAYSRVYTRSHWASDVIAGGIIGYGTASAVASAFKSRLGQRLMVAPTVSRDYAGATISGRF